MEIALEFLNGNPLPRASLLPPHRVDVAYHQVRTFGTANGFRRGNLLEDKLPWVVIDESLPSFSKTPREFPTKRLIVDPLPALQLVDSPHANRLPYGRRPTNP